MIRSSLLRRLLVVPVAFGLAAGAMVATSTGTASAAPIGTLSFYSGVNDLVFNNQNDTFAFQTDGACPTSPTLSTNFLIRVTGPGLPAAPATLVNIQGNTAASTVGSITDGAFDGPVQQTLAGFATVQAQPGGFLGAGTYTMELVCRTAFQSASLGDYVGQFTVTGSGASSVVAAVVPNVDANTTTTLATSPAGSAGWGQAVTLTATVDNTAGNTAPVGTVLFKDDGVAIGSAAAVNGSGVAATTVSDLDVGPNAITAEFTGGAGFKDSATLVATTVTVALGVPTLIRAATLSGAVKVGGTAVCNSGTWSLATSYKYEFLKNGVVAQTSTTDYDIALSAADVGKTLSCRVTGVNPIGNSASASTTAATKVALGSAAVATKAPRIVFSGTAANVGETLKAYRGVWSPAATYTYNYIWKRGTTVIKQGTTATSYKATAKDKGKKLTLTVQVKRVGYATATKTSAAVTVK